MNDDLAFPYISVCIPAYEMNGVGPIFLADSLDILIKQSFQDFEVVVSDNAATDVIKEVCERYSDKLKIHYCRNTDPLRGMSSNVNNALQNACGKLIKILFLDDYLANDEVLQVIVDNFDLSKDCWLASGCEHTEDGNVRFAVHLPSYNDTVYTGNNTIGSPSVITLKNERILSFDEKLKWLMDCDYYKRCYDTFGEPKIVSRVLTVIRVGNHQTTNTLATDVLRYREYCYVVKKYEKGLNYWWLIAVRFTNYHLYRARQLLYWLVAGIIQKIKGARP